MRTENKNIFQKGLKILKRLYFKNEDIMVTGSVALDIIGILPPDRVSHDIDFIVKADTQTWRCMKLIEAINDNEYKDNGYPDRKNMVILTVDGITLNVWKYDSSFDWSSIKDEETGVYVATANHIIRAKKNYGRVKDLTDLADICKNIL